MVVAAIVVGPVGIAIVVPGVSLRVSIWVSFRSSFSLPLLAAPVAIAMVTIGSVAIVATIVWPIATIVVPGVSLRVSFSYCISLSFRGGKAQPKQAKHKN